MATRVYNLKKANPSLCGKERRKLGEFIEDNWDGHAKYDPATSTVVFTRRITPYQDGLIIGFIAGMGNANYWADDDADIEDEDASE